MITIKDHVILPLADNQTLEIFQLGIAALDTTVVYSNCVTVTTILITPAWTLISTQHILLALPNIVITMATVTQYYSLQLHGM